MRRPFSTPFDDVASLPAPGCAAVRRTPSIASSLPERHAKPLNPFHKSSVLFKCAGHLFQMLFVWALSLCGKVWPPEGWYFFQLSHQFLTGIISLADFLGVFHKFRSIYHIQIIYINPHMSKPHLPTCSSRQIAQMSHLFLVHMISPNLETSPSKSHQGCLVGAATGSHPSRPIWIPSRTVRPWQRPYRAVCQATAPCWCGERSGRDNWPGIIYGWYIHIHLIQNLFS